MAAYIDNYRASETSFFIKNNYFYSQDSCRLVGGSKFYELMDGSQAAETSTPSPTEKHDHMKPIESDDEGNGKER